MAKRPAARKHTELDTWQLANELRQLVFNSTKGASRPFRTLRTSGADRSSRA